MAALLPARLEVVVVADRASAIPPLLDRLQASGWHWVIRVTTTSSHRWCDAPGREHALRAVVRQHLGQPGHRWRARGCLVKDAGWRRVEVLGVWQGGAKEPLVVITDLRERWRVLRLYDRRFWGEAGFRTDTSTGWQWEASQVQGVAHHLRLLLGMAWASLVVLCGGGGGTGHGGAVGDAGTLAGTAAGRPCARKRVHAGAAGDPALAVSGHALRALLALVRPRRAALGCPVAAVSSFTPHLRATCPPMNPLWERGNGRRCG